MASIESTAITNDLVGALIEQVHGNETAWNRASRLKRNDLVDSRMA